MNLRRLSVALAVLSSPGCYSKPASIPEGTDSGSEGASTTVQVGSSTTGTDPSTGAQPTSANPDGSGTDAGPTDSGPTTATEGGSGSDSGTVEPACGDGTFTPGEFCPAAAPDLYDVGNGAVDVVIANLDGASGPDLVSLNSSATTVSVIYNDGTGTFGAPDGASVGDYSCRIRAVDAEGDGDIDLVVAGDPIVTLVNDGTGELDRNDSTLSAGGFGGCSDHNDLDILNDDGGPWDIIYSGAYNNTYAAGQNPPGGWTFTSASGIGGITEGSAGVTATEFLYEADSFPDVIVLNQYYNTGELFRGDGAGGFTAAGTYQSCTGMAGNAGSRFADTGDLDGDGQIDIVTTCMAGNFTIAIGASDGTFAPPIDVVYDGAYRPMVTDVDGDDDLDILVTSSTLNRINVYINDGAGSMADPVQLDLAYPVFSVDVRDLDGDDAPEIVTAQDTPEGGRIAVFHNDV